MNPYGYGGPQRFGPLTQRQPAFSTGQAPNLGMRTQIANAMSSPLTAPQVQPNAQPRMMGIPRAPARAMSY